MKRLAVSALWLGCIFLLASGCTAGEGKKELKGQKEKESYIIGFQLGKDFKNQEMDFDLDILVQGIRDAMSDSKPLLSEEEAKETMMAFQQGLIEKREARIKSLAEKNKKEGEAFLSGNAKKEGVVTLESGLQYKVLTEGTGKSPQKSDSVTVNYRGTLIDGTEFDSSYKRGQPATFPVGGVIPGWTEALQLMKEGAKWQLFIPSELAYGERGAGAMIGPNTTLLFEVELISIQ